MFRWGSVAATDDHGHPMASVLINKAAELGVDFKYYEEYTNKHDSRVGFDLVALVLAQLPAMNTLDLSWLDTYAYTPVRMPEPCGGWPWSQSRKGFFTYLSFSSSCLIVQELKRFLHPVDNQTWKVNQPHSSRDGLDPLLQRRHHQSSCLSPPSLSRVIPLLSGARRLERLLMLGISVPYLSFSFDNLWELNLLGCHFISCDLRNLVRRCKRLRKFVYTGRATGSQLIQSLEPAQSSLGVLGIDRRRWVDPLALRIPSLQQFTALKVLHIDFHCFWDWQARETKDSPPWPDMLFATLLPESVEEVALFGRGCYAGTFGFEAEAHVKRLALDRKESGRFQRLRKLHGQDFWPFGYNVDPKSDNYDDILSRITTMDDAKTTLGDDGVEVIFSAEMDAELQFGNIISFW